MGYLNNVYAQNWVEQMRTNHERCHPELDMRRRMQCVDMNEVDVFYWGDAVEGARLWRRRHGELYQKVFGLIR